MNRHRKIAIASFKAEARKRSRASRKISYCQALDLIAQEHGHSNWKALSKAYAVASPQSPITVSLDVARSSARKVNAWIASAFNEGLAAGAKLALSNALSSRPTTYDDRFRSVCIALGKKPEGKEQLFIYEAAAHIVASMAHDALAEKNWEMHCCPDPKSIYAMDQVVSATGRMHSMYLDSDRVNLTPEDQATDTAAWYVSSWTWFDEMASRAAYFIRPDAKFAFERVREMSYQDHVAVEHLVLSLRHIENPQLATFEKHIAARYAHCVGGSIQDHAEVARMTLEVYLQDNGIPFGHPSVKWDQALADEIANDDLTAWPDNM